MIEDNKETNDSWTPRSYPIPEYWIYTELEIVFENLPLTDKKLAQKNYDAQGKFPVVDQGASEIGGYSNDDHKLINLERPAIVFGDHTMCLKYINFSFIPGADGVKVLVPRNPIDPKYAFYACKSLRLPDRGYSRHYSFLKRCNFPLAPVNEQKRIVAKIEELFSELDNGIAALKTARKQLKVYRQAILKNAFEGKLTSKWREENADKLETPEQLLARIQKERDARYQQQLDEWKTAVKEWEVGGNKGKRLSKPKEPEQISSLLTNETDWYKLPKEWIFLRLGNFIEKIDAGKSFKCEEREPTSGEIGVAKVSAVTWGKYNESESKTCLDLAKVNPDYFIKNDDFILSRANTIELVGACVIARKVTKPIMLSDKTLRINFSGINQRYVLQYLRSHSGRNEIMDKSTGNQESMRNIGQDRIKSIVIPICGSAEMDVIETAINEKLESVSQLSKEIEIQFLKAETLRQSILKKAFSGQLVPQDPSDEPASELMESIKTEKVIESNSKAINKKQAKQGRHL